MTDHPPPVLSNFWLDQALAEETGTDEAPPLSGDAHVDVVIVGGGYAGLWTAIELKGREPGLDVMLIEKQVCGWGASGRNSGFLLDLWSMFPTMQARFGRAAALAQGGLRRQHMSGGRPEDAAFRDRERLSQGA